MVRICVYQGKQLFEMSVTTNRKAYGLVYLSSMAPLKEATPQLNSVRLSLSLFPREEKGTPGMRGPIAHFDVDFEV